MLPAADGSLLAAPVDQGGGLRTGERHLQRVTLDGAATVTWAPPASTLALPPPTAAAAPTPACQQLAAHVTGGSYLRALGQPLIPFAGAAVVQSTVVSLTRGGECLLIECGCPGRSRMGESWQFARLGYRLTLLRDRTVLYRERWDLRPPAVPHGPGGFGGSRGWATCIAAGPRAVAELHALRRRLTGSGAHLTYGTLAPATTILRLLDPHGHIITALATLAHNTRDSPPQAALN